MTVTPTHTLSDTVSATLTRSLTFSSTLTVSATVTRTPTPDMRYYRLRARVYDEGGEKVAEIGMGDGLSFEVESLSWKDGGDRITEPGQKLVMLAQNGRTLFEWSGRSADGLMLQNGSYLISVEVSARGGAYLKTMTISALVMIAPRAGPSARAGPNPYFRLPGGEVTVSKAGAPSSAVRRSRSACRSTR